eukprot:CAMPEP_0184319810 /NCGR_PEP_ID=MMETSP1049-20130417/110697_1 /TAXON_ID=77928 /ORGANISM="Proteomonas sulcata, Strain CCMP704" /LENGTH=53 /DNA_ID=CAMNT_0026640115 /DNA_START=469 /DNA_END=627 /DNA_ORIENTATION=+
MDYTTNDDEPTLDDEGWLILDHEPREESQYGVETQDPGTPADLSVDRSGVAQS